MLRVLRQPLRRPELRLGAAAAAAFVVISGSGDVVLVAALLAVAGADLVAGVVAGLAAAAMAVRWGTTALDAVSGAQAVLAPGALAGPLTAAASSWCAASAVVCASPRGWPAPAFGVFAAFGLFGPALTGPADAAVRLVGAALLALLCVVVSRRARPAAARPLALALGVAGVALAVLPG